MPGIGAKFEPENCRACQREVASKFPDGKLMHDESGAAKAPCRAAFRVPFPIRAEPASIGSSMPSFRTRMFSTVFDVLMALVQGMLVAITRGHAEVLGDHTLLVIVAHACGYFCRDCGIRKGRYELHGTRRDVFPCAIETLS